MILQAWLLIGVVGVIATGAALQTNDDSLAMLTGVTGFIAWGVWAFGALDLEVYRNATVYTVNEPVVAIVGVMLALLPGWIALTGPIEAVSRVRDGRPDEM